MCDQGHKDLDLPLRFASHNMHSTATTMIKLFLVGTLSISAIAVKHDLSEQLCNSVMTMSTPTDGIYFPIALKMHELIHTIDEASDFAQYGCGGGCKDDIPSFNATEFAARDAVRALSTYIGRLNPSINTYVDILGFNGRLSLNPAAS